MRVEPVMRHSMTPQAEIRIATSEDAEAALKYFAALQAEELETVYRVEVLPTLDQEIEFLSGFEACPDSAWFALESGGAIVGNLGIRAESRPQTRHIGNLGMSILSPFRSIGLGTRLMEAALAWSSSTNLRRIQLEVLENNPRALSLYERFGFSTEGRRPGGVLVGDQYLDLIQMGRAVPIPPHPP